mmetsp:Transcript_16966/g.23845  ORF Transcript_16966/g.23845 Transcript_16966/m.23845 type:complete len:139 (+) Transcript_16966:78-494(+)
MAAGGSGATAPGLQAGAPQSRPGCLLQPLTPSVPEIKLLQKTIKYCKDLLQSKVEEKKDKKKEEDRDEEFYVTPIKFGKKGKTNNKGRDARPEKITHNAETIRLFQQLKLDAPVTMDQVPVLLADLEIRSSLESFRAG